MMKKLSSMGMLVIAFCGAAIDADAQSIIMHDDGQPTETVQLSDVRKITFFDPVMEIHMNDGSIVTWNVLDLSHVTHVDGASTNVQKAIAATALLKPSFYPNPANGQLNISYELPKSGQVTIEWLDVTGKVLEQINNTTQQAGHQQVLWNTSKYTAGTYFCRIKGVSFAVTQLILTQ